MKNLEEKIKVYLSGVVGTTERQAGNQASQIMKFLKSDHEEMIKKLEGMNRGDLK